MKLNIYMAGYDNPRKSNNKEVRGFYMTIKQKIAATCDVYLPFVDVEKKDNPYTIWKKRKDAVCNCDIVVAYVGKPCITTGMILSYAQKFKKPTILVVESELFTEIEPCVYGNPANSETIKFNNFEDAMVKIQQKINAMRPDMLKKKQNKAQSSKKVG